MNDDRPEAGNLACPVPSATRRIDLAVVELRGPAIPADYLQAMAAANREAAARLVEPMLLSWYDRDRDFESPQHVSECHLDSAIPGYVDYALSHGATLKVDIDGGHYVFFYLDVAL